MELNNYELVSSSGIAVVMRERYKVSHEKYYIGPFKNKEEAEQHAKRYRETAEERNRFNPLPRIGRIYVVKITPEISEELISPDAGQN